MTKGLRIAFIVLFLFPGGDCLATPHKDCDIESLTHGGPRAWTRSWRGVPMDASPVETDTAAMQISIHKKTCNCQVTVAEHHLPAGYGCRSTNAGQMVTYSTNFGLFAGVWQNVVPGVSSLILTGNDCELYVKIGGQISGYVYQPGAHCYPLPTGNDNIQQVMMNCLPTAVPTAAPTAAPTAVPTAAPTAAPTVAPTAAPTATPTALYAGEYEVWYQGSRRSTNMLIACNNSATQPGIFVDSLHFDSVMDLCTDPRDTGSTMYIMNTHGVGKYECLRSEADILTGSHYLADSTYWGSVEYRLMAPTDCTMDPRITLTHTADDGNSIPFAKRQLVDGALCWTDRAYTYNSVGTSGIPSGSTFWAGRHKEYTGSNNLVTLTTQVAVDFYFWSGTHGRDGGWPNLYSEYSTGRSISYTGWANRIYQMTVYKMRVGAGQSVNITLTLAGGGFTGGFAYSQPEPTPAPTSAPTPASTPATPKMAESAKAFGDPHLQNIYGQKFDLMRPGRHPLVHIPRGADARDILLHVEANVQRLGARCEDVYFQELNVTGLWAEANKKGGLHFRAGEPVPAQGAAWINLGKVAVKVAHGHTLQGAQYLNFYVKHLGQIGYMVGGLLGADDHTLAASPDVSCHHRVAVV